MLRKVMSIVWLVIFATASSPSITKAENKLAADGLTRAQVLKYPLIGTAVSVVTANSIGVIDSTDFANAKLPWWFPIIPAPQHMLMYKIDKPRGIKYSIAEAGFLATHYATNNSPTATKTAFNLYLMTAWYSTYDMYRITRGEAKPGVYESEWKGYGVKELAVAPLKWENISQPLFYIPVGLITWGMVSNIGKSDSSIFATNKAYIDGNETPMGQAISMIIGNNIIHYLATAIGEEALYRGVVYEELRASFGPKKAKLIDFFLFPALHIAPDLAKGRGSEEITSRFIERGVATLLFDYAYDKGGLPLSISLHTWFNFINFTGNWMRDGGEPSPSEDGDPSTSLTAPPLMISFTFRF